MEAILRLTSLGYDVRFYPLLESRFGEGMAVALSKIVGDEVLSNLNAVLVHRGCSPLTAEEVIVTSLACVEREIEEVIESRTAVAGPPSPEQGVGEARPTGGTSP